MLKRFKQLMLVATLGVLLSVGFSGTAQAEQCVADTGFFGTTGTFCLVTDTSQPLVPPTTLQFRVTSEATAFWVSSASFEVYAVVCGGELVQQGSPGGMSLWNIDLCPRPDDGLLTLTASATMPAPCTECSDNVEATFQIPVLAAAANLTTTIRRQGKWFVARTSYDGRGPVTADIVFAIESIKHLKSGGEPVGVFKKRRRVEVTPPGHQEFIQKIPVNAVKQTCRTRTQCQLSSFANLSVATPDPSDGKDIYSAHAFRKRKGPLIG